MKTLVIGANGKIGKIFCQKAGAAGIAVRTMVRDSSQLGALKAPGVEPVLGDLEGNFANAFEDCDRVVFTAGSWGGGGHIGGDKTLLIDLHGAIRAIEASERNEIRHFVMVSALRANEPLAAPPAVRHYMVAKLLADERLEASRVPSTILRPGRLTDEPAGGRICVDPSEATGYDVSRENVALCILAALDSFAHEDRTIDLVDGNTAIKDVFSA